MDGYVYLTFKLLNLYNELNEKGRKELKHSIFSSIADELSKNEIIKIFNIFEK